MTSATRTLLSATALVLAACRATEETLPAASLRLERVAGDGQELGAEDISDPLVVLVRDEAGDPLPGTVVTWSVTAGPGHVGATTDTTREFDGTSDMRYVATADTGAVVVMARVGASDSTTFTLQVGTPCSVGVLTVGQTIDSTFPSGRCSHGEFDLALVAGQAYFITLTHQPDPARAGVDSVDPVLTFWQSAAPGPVRTLTAQRLALSDEEGGDRNSELFFVAPSSGTYRVLVGHRAPFGPGAYRLEAQSCLVLGPAPISGTVTYLLPAIPADACIRHYRAGGTSRYRFLSIPKDSLEQLTVSISSTAFTPVWQFFDSWDPSHVGGPGPVVGTDSTRTLDTFAGGNVTIAIGGSTPTATGDFTVTLTRTPLNAASTTEGSRP